MPPRGGTPVPPTYAGQGPGSIPGATGAPMPAPGFQSQLGTYTYNPNNAGPGHPLATVGSYQNEWMGGRQIPNAPGGFAPQMGGWGDITADYGSQRYDPVTGWLPTGQRVGDPNVHAVNNPYTPPTPDQIRQRLTDPNAPYNWVGST